MRIKILLLVGTLVIVGIVIIDAFSNNSQKIGYLGRKDSKNSESRQADLKSADEMLHAILWQLQDLDQRFATLITMPNEAGAMEKTNASIQYTEEAFRKSIDSVARIGNTYDEESGSNDFQNMTIFFKKILENRRFIAFTRMGVISGSAGSGNDKQTILKLQNELYEKEKMIASSSNNKTVMTLQNQIDEREKQILDLQSQMQKNETEKQGFVQTAQRLQGEVAEKDKMIAALGNKKTSTDQQAFVNLQKELSERNKQISDLQTLSQSQKLTYTQSVQKLQTELSEKTKIAANANKNLPADQKALTNLQNEITIKTRQINDLQTQMQKELAEKKTYSQRVQKFQTDLSEKNKMIDALSNIKIPTDDKALASLQKEVNTKNKKISDLENELNAKDKTIASNSASSKVPPDQKGLISLQNEVNTKNKQINTLQAEMRKEQTEKQKYSETISNLQLELIEKNKLIASAGSRKVPADQKALVTLQNEIVEKDRRIKRLEQQLLTSSTVAKPVESDNNEISANLRLAYNNTMTQLGVLQKKYNSLKAEMDQLRGQR